MNRDIAFIVGLIVDKKIEGILKRGLPKFCFISDTQEEAQREQAKLEKDYKKHLEQGEKFTKVMLWPVLITTN